VSGSDQNHPQYKGQHVAKRAVLIAVACAAIVVAGGLISWAARENDKPATAAITTIAPGSTVAAHGNAVIDGQRQEMKGTCSAPAAGGRVDISLSGDPPTIVNVTLDNAQPPNVSSVVLGASSMAFMYQPGQQGTAAVTQQGNTYHITGTLLRYGFVSKPFDITVTCA
jgi:hypothetical protein